MARITGTTDIANVEVVKALLSKHDLKKCCVRLERFSYTSKKNIFLNLISLSYTFHNHTIFFISELRALLEGHGSDSISPVVMERETRASSTDKPASMAIINRTTNMTDVKVVEMLRQHDMKKCFVSIERFTGKSRRKYLSI